MKKEKKLSTQLPTIAEYLFKQNHIPKKIRKGGKEFWYSSPITGSDSNPSFKVDIQKDVWFDHSTGVGGHIADLVVQMKNVSDKEAYRILYNETPVADHSKMTETFHDVQAKTINEGEVFQASQNEYISHKDLLKNSMAIKYLKSRGINPNDAANHMSVVLYKSNGNLRKDGKPFFAIGWKNMSGGWELTSMSTDKRFKSSIGKKDLTYIRCKRFETTAKEVTIFESMIDFLSILNYTNRADLIFNTDIIILNTTAVFQQYFERLTNHYHTFHCYTDNDEAGTQIIQSLQYKIESKRILVNDCRPFFDGFKDINDKVVRHQAERGAIDQTSLRYNASFKESIFKALVLYKKSTSVHMTDDLASKYWYSLDTKEEREKHQKKLKFNETIDELISTFSGFRIMYERVMKQKAEGVVQSVTFYYNQVVKGVDNTIL
ncbi:toprim domain-containing protein [Flammeovirga sp. OC4]|uniref:toprim domain-containing protein n=1 Tax=Flammeovirga sp. OC4 TaxID=1382345 RepID=UPI0005C608FF|nr:toprim domain-containing protein [Flammeovirga sp. OC4]